jgi:hypothetical protein
MFGGFTAAITASHRHDNRGTSMNSSRRPGRPARAVVLRA